MSCPIYCTTILNHSGTLTLILLATICFSSSSHAPQITIPTKRNGFWLSSIGWIVILFSPGLESPIISPRVRCAHAHSGKAGSVCGSSIWLFAWSASPSLLISTSAFGYKGGSPLLFKRNKSDMREKTTYIYNNKTIGNTPLLYTYQCHIHEMNWNTLATELSPVEVKCCVHTITNLIRIFLFYFIKYRKLSSPNNIDRLRKVSPAW